MGFWLIVVWVLVLPLFAAVSYALSDEWWLNDHPLIQRALRFPVYIYGWGIIGLGIWGLIAAT